MRSDPISRTFFIEIGLREIQVQSLRRKEQQVKRVQLLFVSSSASIRLHVMHALPPRVTRLAYSETRLHFRDVQSPPSGVADMQLVAVHSEQIRRDAGVRRPLDSGSPLVRSAQTTRRDGPAPNLDRRAGGWGSRPNLLADRWLPDHTRPPARQPCWSGAGRPQRGWRGRAGGGQDDCY